MIGFRTRQQSSGSHQLDGQRYAANMSDRDDLYLDLNDRKFTLALKSCYTTTEQSGNYRLDGTSLVLHPSLGPDLHYELRDSAGRTYLDSKGGDLNVSLKLTAGANGAPSPPHWRGGALRVNGLHPGMSESDLAPNLQLIKTAGELGIYSSPKRDLVAGVYRGRGSP